MGAERARRWKLLPFRSLSLPPSPAASKPKTRPPPDADVTVPLPPPPATATKEKGEEEEEVPADFLCCPILRAPMADPVILPSGRTFERACVLACAELGLTLGPDGGVVAAAADRDASPGGGVPAAIPNDALRAAVRTWCARSGRAAPVPPSAEEARLAVLRAAAAAAAGTQPPARSSSNLSCSSEGAPVPARSASNLSCSSEGASAASTSSSSSGRSSREMAPVEVQAVKEEQDEPVAVRVADAQEEVVVKAVEAGDEAEVEAAMAALRRATREGAARRRALCVPRLLAALRRVLLSSRHTASARADAAAALANLSLEPENRVPVVRAGAVPALVEVLASSAAEEAREHAAGALFGLALHEGNRAAIGVLGAVPPLLAAFADRAAPPRARRDAGMALYHLSFAAVNQCKLARAPGASRALLAVACDAAEPPHIRRLALMVLCNVAACAEGTAALMDAGAVATASAILSEGGGACSAELQECCVEALYAMSRGSPRFRGLARAAGADRPLMLIAEQGSPGVDREVVQTVLRTMGRDSSDDDHTSVCRSDEGHHGGGRSSLPHRRRVASWSSAPPAATPPSSHQWRSVCID